MKTILKTVIACLLVGTLLVGGIPAAHAEYYESLELSIDFPEGYEVITREKLENGYIFEGYDSDTLLTQFRQNNIYADALPDDVSCEIVVSMAESPLNSYIHCSDETLTFLATSICSTLESQNTYVDHWDIYSNEDARYLRVWYLNPVVANSFTLQYNTVYAGYVYNVFYHSYIGEISAASEAMLQRTIDSIVFHREDPAATTPVESDPFTYTEEESGVSFTVPSNWVQRERPAESQLDGMFAPNGVSGYGITFQATDLWSETYEQIGYLYSREEFDTLFTAADYADMIGVDPYEIDTTIYGGVYYYTAIKQHTTDESFPFEWSYISTNLLYIRNGWLYCFSFYGEEDSEYYADFESLMRSVSYPYVATTTKAPSTTQKTTTTTPTTVTATPTQTAATTVPTQTTVTTQAAATTQNNGFYMLLIAAAVILLVIVALAVWLLFIRPKPGHHAVFEKANSCEDYSPCHARFCRFCGTALPEGVTVCPACNRSISYPEKP